MILILCHSLYYVLLYLCVLQGTLPVVGMDDGLLFQWGTGFKRMELSKLVGTAMTSKGILYENMSIYNVQSWY